MVSGFVSSFEVKVKEPQRFRIRVSLRLKRDSTLRLCQGDESSHT